MQQKQTAIVQTSTYESLIFFKSSKFKIITAI